MRNPKINILIGSLITTLAAFAASASGRERDADTKHVARRVLTILTRCIECHHAEEPAGGLDLTSRASRPYAGENRASRYDPTTPPGASSTARSRPARCRLKSRSVPNRSRWCGNGSTRKPPGTIPDQRQPNPDPHQPLDPASAGSSRAASGPVVIVAGQPDRRVHPGPPQCGRARTGSACRPPDHDPSRDLRPPRPSSHSRRDRLLPR